MPVAGGPSLREDAARRRLRVRPIAFVVVVLLAAACTYIPPSPMPVSEPPTSGDPSPIEHGRAPYSGGCDHAFPGRSLPRRHGAVRAGDPLSISCDSPAFSTTILDEPAEDEFEDHPSAAALRRALTLPRDPGVGDLGWWRVARDERSATYLTGAGPVYNYFVVEVGPAGWGVDRALRLSARSRRDLDGHRPVTWTLDPAFPAPTAVSRQLHALVLEEACASGKPVAGPPPRARDRL